MTATAAKGERLTVDVPDGARVAVVVATVAGLLLLLLGSPAGALAAVAGTGVVWLAWRYPVRPQDPRGFPLT